jgi:hypothetical protein
MGMGKLALSFSYQCPCCQPHCKNAYKEEILRVQSLNLTILNFGVTNEAIHYLDTNICLVISMVSLLVTLEEFTTFLSFIIQQRCCALDVVTWGKKWR